jgi:sugar phosphate isomerase/epimerase
MARSPIDDVANAVKDAAYVSVGLGVIAFQRLQVRRNELAKALSGEGDANGALGVVGALVGDRLKLVEERLDAAREQLSAHLPGSSGR